MVRTCPIVSGWFGVGRVLMKCYNERGQFGELDNLSHNIHGMFERLSLVWNGDLASPEITARHDGCCNFSKGSKDSARAFITLVTRIPELNVTSGPNPSAIFSRVCFAVSTSDSMAARIFEFKTVMEPACR